MKPKNQVEYRPVSRLKELPGNPRTIKKDQFEKLKASISANADYFEARPCILSDRTGELVVIAGNQRLKAAKALKMAEIPTILLPNLTEEREKEIIIRDNVENGEWDMDILANEWDIEALDEWGVDVPEFGDALDQNTVVEDDFDETQEQIEQRVQSGDIWQLGEHRLMCGDSTSMADFALLMNGERADITFTSPPYNAGSLNQKGNPRTDKKYGMYDDNKTSSEYLQFLSSNIDVLLANSEEIFYNIGLVSGNKKEIFILINKYLDNFKDMLYWEKSNCAPCIQAGVINNLVEFIIAFGHNGTRKFRNPQFTQGSYYNVVKGRQASDNEYSKIHKATFPVYLPAEFIKTFTPKDAIVIDCFGGTGTTLIACEQLGRKCYMMELDPHYCDVIIKRWENFTGEKARKNDSSGHVGNS